MFTTYQFSKAYVTFNFKVSLPVANRLRKIEEGFGNRVAISTDQNI